MPQTPEADGIGTTDFTPAPEGVAPASTLPEAPCSCNVYVTISGHKVQVTLRDTDEQRMLERLQTLLDRYPAPPSVAPTETTARMDARGTVTKRPRVSARGKGAGMARSWLDDWLDQLFGTRDACPYCGRAGNGEPCDPYCGAAAAPPTPPVQEGP